MLNLKKQYFSYISYIDCEEKIKLKLVSFNSLFSYLITVALHYMLTMRIIK